jgi:hypothetical protein
MDETIAFFLKPFVIWAVLAFIIGQLVKAYLWTKKRANTPGKLQWFWRMMRRTRVVHPAAVGVVIGYFWPGEIEPGYMGGEIQGMMYFCGAGIMTTFGYHMIKEVAAKKYNIKLPDKIPDLASIPPESEKPPAAEEPPKEE